MDTTAFKWTEYSFQDPKKPNGEGFTKWQMIEVDKLKTIEEIAEKNRLSPLRSVWLFDSDKIDENRRPIGRKIGDFHMDFDSEELETAQNHAIYIIDTLQRRYGLNPNSLEIIFSGSKGFSVIIPYKCFLIDVPTNIIEMYKMMGEYFKLFVYTLDLSIYITRRQWKLTNSKHPKTGLYRIQLTYKELCDKRIKTIKEIAINPKTVKYDEPVFCESLSKQIYGLPALRIELKIDKKPKKKWGGTYNDKWYKLTYAERIPRYFRRTFPQPGRNEAMCKLVGQLKKAGVPREDTKMICLEFNRLYCCPPKTEEEALIPFNQYY
jgi:hypothetical protein